MAYLHGRGLSDTTIAHFGLGLADPYIDQDGVTHSSALLAPMRSVETGVFLKKFHSTNIPGFTENPRADKGWMSGRPLTYWADSKRGQHILFVCEGEKDVWMHWQELNGLGLTDRIMIMTSTHGTGIPSEWNSEEFWNPWSAIYLAQDNDDTGRRLVETVRRLVGARDAYRAEVPLARGKDWNDYWLQGGTIEEFTQKNLTAPSSFLLAPPAPTSPTFRKQASHFRGRGSGFLHWRRSILTTASRTVFSTIPQRAW